MTKFIILFNFLLFFTFVDLKPIEQQDYKLYHQKVIEAENLIVLENYTEALEVYEQLFDDYDFVFLREYQIASQLALYGNDNEKAFKYLRQGILSGWELNSIRKNDYLTILLKSDAWKSIENEYPKLREQYESKLNKSVQERVKSMYSKDQKMALKALFKIGSKAQEKYAEKKFAPHSENQITEFLDIFEKYGYPGEKLIGNNTWMSVILSHHNSISTAYNKKDTLYPNLKPKLWDAMKNGEMSPYEFALIDDWYRTVSYDRKEPSYGILDPPSESNLLKTDELRFMILARPFELRDDLVNIQNITGMNFYLSDRWY